MTFLIYVKIIIISKFCGRRYLCFFFFEVIDSMENRSVYAIMVSDFQPRGTFISRLLNYLLLKCTTSLIAPITPHTKSSSLSKPFEPNP